MDCDVEQEIHENAKQFQIAYHIDTKFSSMPVLEINSSKLKIWISINSEYELRRHPNCFILILVSAGQENR